MACVHPVEEGIQSEFYEYGNAPTGLENGGRILELIKKGTELPPASQSVSQSVSQQVSQAVSHSVSHLVSRCVCMAIDDMLSLSQKPSLDHIPSQIQPTPSVLLRSILILCSR